MRLEWRKSDNVQVVRALEPLNSLSLSLSLSSLAMMISKDTDVGWSCSMTDTNLGDEIEVKLAEIELAIWSRFRSSFGVWVPQ